VGLAPRSVHPMTDAPRALDDVLRLAQDLCLGIAAFYVTPGGEVRTTLSEVMTPHDGEARVVELARSCLAHPTARGRSLFWSAEAIDDNEPSDCTLACVVAPVWSGDVWRGLLGVADVWLPDLDDEQRAGLLALARRVAAQFGTSAGGAVAPPPPTVAVVEPTTAASPPPPPPPPPPAQPEPRPDQPIAAPPVLAPPVVGAPARGFAPPAPPAPAPAIASGAMAGPGGVDPTTEPFLGEVLDHLPHGLVVTRADGAIVLVNQTFAAMTGLAMDDLLGEDVTAVFSIESAGGGAEGATPPPGGAALGGGWMAGMLGEAGTGQRLRVRLPTGERLVVRASGRRVRSRFAGDCVVTLVQPTDGLALPVPLAAGASVEELLDSVEEGIVCCDAAGTVVLANSAARIMHGLPADEPMVGRPFPATTALRTPDGAPVTAEVHPLIEALFSGVPVAGRFVRPNGEGMVHVAISARPLPPGGPGGAIAMLRDVSAEHAKQESLEYFALHDPLTGVANRYLLLEELRRMLDGLARRGGFVSLVYLDLDNFKEVNDVHGHEVGDEVLRAITRRLQRAVRGEDVVARIGGDELVVAHVTADRLSDADIVVARVRKVLSAPYRFGTLVLDVGASVGWVSTSTGDESAEELINEADRAMYDEKRRRTTQGRGATG
jgi:diguanylate cyclase (GGDEF)-like protein